jgi:hypothetical protein
MKLDSITSAKPLSAQEIERETGLRNRNVPQDPTRRFEVGQAVAVGSLQDVEVIEVLKDGLFYVVEYTVAERGGPTYRKRHVWPWTQVFALPEGTVRLYSEDDLRVSSGSMALGSILGYCHMSGVDFTPDYQRPFEWDQADEEALIETIFDRGSIGLMAFNKLPFDEKKPLREIVDGKQRLRAILRFTEGRFPVRGVYWHQIDSLDRGAFENTQIPTLELENASRRDILKLFLRVNRAGRRVSEAHIQAVRDELAALEATVPAAGLPR